MTKTMTVEGMMCGMCEAHVADALRKVPGVEKVKVTRANNQATIHCQEDVSDEALLKAVNDTGYTASNVQVAEETGGKKLFGFKKK